MHNLKARVGIELLFISSGSSLTESLFSILVSSVTEILMMLYNFTEFSDTIEALHNEVEKSCILFARPKLSRMLQLHLLEEWVLDHLQRPELCAILRPF